MGYFESQHLSFTAYVPLMLWNIFGLLSCLLVPSNKNFLFILRRQISSSISIKNFFSLFRSSAVKRKLFFSFSDASKYYWLMILLRKLIPRNIITFCWVNRHEICVNDWFFQWNLDFGFKFALILTRQYNGFLEFELILKLALKCVTDF